MHVIRTHGFSVIEMIVAIFVLSLALTGITTLVQQSLRAGTDFKNTLTANMLAQESLELARGKRDTNVLSGLNWIDGLYPAPCGTADGCTTRISPTDGSLLLQSCSGVCEPLRFNPVSGLYSYDPASLPTMFIRKTWIEEIGVNPPEVKVITRVTWPGLFASTKSVQVEEYLLDWQSF